MTCEPVGAHPASQAERMRSFPARKMSSFSGLSVQTHPIAEEGAVVKCSTLAVQTLINQPSRSRSAPIFRAEGESEEGSGAVTLLAEGQSGEKEGASQASTSQEPHEHKHSPYPHAVITFGRRGSKSPVTQLHSLD
jgi:hypothetical protein